MSMVSILSIVTLVVVSFYVVVAWKSKGKKKLPPGPPGFPLFGSLNLLGKLPHQDFLNLARQYGPIMHLRLGLIPTVVVSSPRAAELFLKTHDLVFASRPPLESFKHGSWDQKNMAFAMYGSYWRDMRKMCTLELLSGTKITSFSALRREEVGLLVDSLREAARAGEAVNLTARAVAMTIDLSCRMVFGKKYSDGEFSEKGFKAVIQEGSQLSAAPNVGDFIPFLAPFDVQGYAKRLKKVRRVYDEFFDKIIDEHIANSWDAKHGKAKDFVDVMVSIMGSQQSEYQIERDNIKAVMLDMLTASMDTSAASIEWAMSELIKNPRTLKALQNELEMVVGLNRMVEESDLQNLKYLDMVVKESFRLHPPVAMPMHYSAYEDCTVDGFYIPRKSRVFINLYAVGRDPDAWTDPDTFLPERFIDNNVDLRGKDYQLIPFGAGRRGCPGLQLGLAVVKLTVAQLAHCFDWKLPDGKASEDLDMEEVFGLTVPRANHLVVVPSYRLQV